MCWGRQRLGNWLLLHSPSIITQDLGRGGGGASITCTWGAGRLTGAYLPPLGDQVGGSSGGYQLCAQGVESSSHLGILTQSKWYDQRSDSRGNVGVWFIVPPPGNKQSAHFCTSHTFVSQETLNLSLTVSTDP